MESEIVIYLKKLCGLEVDLPIPTSRFSKLLYKIYNSDFVLDFEYPVSRIERYLFDIINETAEMIDNDPQSNIEKFLAVKIGRTDIELPNPLSCIDWWLNEWLKTVKDIYVEFDGAVDYTINESLSGNIKIKEIAGNSYQEIKTNIVPDPSNPVSVISKKIKVKKMPSNLFDMRIEGNIDLVPDEGTYKSIAEHQLKPSTSYKISFTSVEVPAKANLSLRIKTSGGTVICNVYTFFNMGSTPKTEAGVENTFTTDATGKILFEYNCMVNLSSTTETYIDYWYTKITKDIKLYENAEPVEEVVELRSLKESSNLFDIKMYGFEVGLLNNNGILQPGFTTYFTSGYIPIKKSTQYMVGILGLDGYTLTGIFFYDQNYNLVAKTDSKPFTTPTNSMYVKFGCTKNGGATDEINKHAMLVEGTTVPSAYVAPTVRDYKIVDHVNKKAWIERNIQEVNLNNLNFVYSDTKTDYTRFYAPLNPTIKYANEIYSNSFPSYKSYDYTKESIYGGNTSGGKTLSVIVKDSNVAEHTKEALLNYINNPNAVAYYALETPVIEEIPYVESDISEFGVSSQDTTSPSPTIKSEIETVTELNIKSHGKNFLNETLAKDYSNYVSLGNGYSKFIVSVNPGTEYVVSRRDTVGLGTNCYVWIKGVASFWMVHTTNENINVNKGYITSTEDGTIEIIIATSNQEKLNQTWDVLGWLQIEEGDTATEYEPYKETSILHELKKPLLSLADGSVADVITLENRINKLSINTFTGKETFSGSYADQKGYYGRYYMLNKAYGNMVQKVFCNGLPHVPSSWSLAQEGCCQNANQLHLKFSNLRLGIKDDTPVSEKMVAFRNYIKEQYDNGTPIEFLYILENPIIEPLELELVEKIESLKSFDGTTHISCSGNLLPGNLKFEIRVKSQASSLLSLRGVNNGRL